MDTIRLCKSCAAPLPNDAPQGLCPKCLVQAAMASQSDATPGQGQSSTPLTKAGPPLPSEISKFFPQLEILELLGAGGMGFVYKARQPNLDRFVALKILPSEAGRDPHFAERFSREAKALARLNHPNIVGVYDFGQSDGFYYFLMEYVDGVNLRQMEKAQRLTPAEALAIVPRICDALQYAHEEGIVHRDIKPANILIDKKGRVKIADFGLAKLLGKAAPDLTLTQANAIMGTPHYMAPEQMERPLEVDSRADIYSLGVVFYEMLTGELPLGRFALPSEKVQVDVRLDEIVLRSLERDVERRYQRVSEVKSGVENISGIVAGLPPNMRMWLGWEYKSKGTCFGLPWLHICSGIDPSTGKRRVAKGVVAIGDIAKGVFAFGGAAYGMVAFGGLAVGGFACAGCALGLLSFGGLALALVAAYGGFAIAPIALGGMAVGYYAFGGAAFGAHAAGGNASDPQARNFFSWLNWSWKYFNLGGLAVMAASMLVSFGGMAWGRRKVAQTPDERAPAFGTPVKILAIFFVILAVAIFTTSRTLKRAGDSGGSISYTFANMDDFVRGPNGPEFSASKIRQLGLTPPQSKYVNQLIPKYYTEFVEMEREHTKVTKDDRGHILITISPFREELLSLAGRLNGEVRALTGKDLIHFDWAGNLRAFGLFRHCGECKVTAELWKELARAWSSDPAGGTYHYKEKYEDNSRSRGGSGGNWTHVFPEEYWTYWSESSAANGSPNDSAGKVAAQLGAAELVQKMQAKYASLMSVTATGKIISEFSSVSGGTPMTNEHTFKIKLARPDFYRIEWIQKMNIIFTNVTLTGAVWYSGKEHSLLMPGGQVGKPLNRELALASATGLSGGAAQVVPDLFFHAEAGGRRRSLTNPLRLPDERIDNEDCYVVSADDPAGKEIVWIMKRNFLLKQMKTAVNGAAVSNEAVQSTADLSDDSLKKLMRMTGQDPTPEAMRKLRQTLDASTKMVGQTRGTITQMFQTMLPDELMDREDFEYPVPPIAR